MTSNISCKFYNSSFKEAMSVISLKLELPFLLNNGRYTIGKTNNLSDCSSFPPINFVFELSSLQWGGGGVLGVGIIGYREHSNIFDPPNEYLHTGVEGDTLERLQAVLFILCTWQKAFLIATL